MPLVEQPSGVINILLLGSDTDAAEGAGRTDTIVVVSVNPDLPSIALISIPRDFYAWIPGYGFDKINTTYSRGARNGMSRSGQTVSGRLRVAGLETVDGLIPP